MSRETNIETALPDERKPRGEEHSQEEARELGREQETPTITTETNTPEPDSPTIDGLEKQEMHLASMLGAEGFDVDGRTLEQLTAAVGVMDLPVTECGMENLGTFGIELAADTRRQAVEAALQA